MEEEEVRWEEEGSLEEEVEGEVKIDFTDLYFIHYKKQTSTDLANIFGKKTSIYRHI